MEDIQRNSHNIKRRVIKGVLNIEKIYKNKCVKCQGEYLEDN